MKRIRILFVCLGNICRSSCAEGVMKKLVEEAGLENRFMIDSAGILSYHQGELPDPRMRAHAARRGYELVHRSRPVRVHDFEDFDVIIGMDDRNVDDLRERHPYDDYVPDPYYGGAEGFEHVIDLLEDGCRNLMERLAEAAR